MARGGLKGWIWGGLVAGGAACVFGGLALVLEGQERRAVEAVRAAVVERTSVGRDGRSVLRPEADVVRMLSAKQLVTVEVSTRVSSASVSESWRGDVRAEASAPVRVLYGVELAGLEVESVVLSPVSREYLVRVPEPVRLATEVRGADESVEVQVGWLRLRSRGGEFHLGLARRGLYEEAEKLMLPADEARRVRERSREAVRELVQEIVGEGAGVTVVFDAGRER